MTYSDADSWYQAIKAFSFVSLEMLIDGLELMAAQSSTGFRSVVVITAFFSVI